MAEQVLNAGAFQTARDVATDYDGNVIYESKKSNSNKVTSTGASTLSVSNASGAVFEKIYARNVNLSGTSKIYRGGSLVNSYNSINDRTLYKTYEDTKKWTLRASISSFPAQAAYFTDSLYYKSATRSTTLAFTDATAYPGISNVTSAKLAVHGTEFSPESKFSYGRLTLSVFGTQNDYTTIKKFYNFSSVNSGKFTFSTSFGAQSVTIVKFGCLLRLTTTTSNYKLGFNDRSYLLYTTGNAAGTKGYQKLQLSGNYVTKIE